MTTVRQAVQDDIPELVRLRGVLFGDLHDPFFRPPPGAEDWRAALADVLRAQLAQDEVHILVVPAGQRLAACGIGCLEQRLPGPHLLNGLIGQVVGVVTDPEHRRRGHSRAIMDGLMAWFRQRGAARVDLHASSQGEPLYRALGFTRRPDPALSWHP